MTVGIFSGLFKSHNHSKDATIGSTYHFFMENSTSGKTLRERSAIQMTAVYSWVRILAETIEHPLYLLLHDASNPEMTSFIFREMLITHLLLRGNAYV